MANRQSKHIMIVEDSVDLQLLLARLLTKQGYQVSRAYNGQEALESLRQMPQLPSLILLDLMMPVMDGILFGAELKKDPALCKIPFVIMTADAQPDAKAAQLQAAALMRKPLDMHRLLALAEQFSA